MIKYFWVISFIARNESGIAFVLADTERNAFQALKQSGRYSGTPNDYTLVSACNVGKYGGEAFGLQLESYTNALVAYDAISNILQLLPDTQAERERVLAELQRVDAESQRAYAETQRELAESERDSRYEAAEQLRNQRYDGAEISRNMSYTQAEQYREQRFKDAASHESEREANERVREQNEQTRVTNEQGRVEAESGRVRAEGERVLAEQHREEEMAAYLEKLTPITESEYAELERQGEVDPDRIYFVYEDEES